MDNTRNRQKQKFLDDFFRCKQYKIHPLTADASFRTYDRIISNDDTLILMDSPTEYYTLSKFTKIATFLYNHNFSVPQLFKADHDLGLLLLEDFGSISVNSHLKKINSDEKFKIYQLMIDLLCELQQLSPPNNWPTYSLQLLQDELAVYVDWYLIDHKILTERDKAEIYEIWKAILNQLPDLGGYLIHRDYHVDNLMMLSRDRTKAIGLLDFQDAMIGSPLYDVASLLEDARIDVCNSFADRCLGYYLQKNNFNKEEALLAYTILCAQRNSRVLGVFMRKYKRDNQSNFLQYIPRVEDYLKNNLKHPIFKNLNNWLQNRSVQ